LEPIAKNGDRTSNFLQKTLEFNGLKVLSPFFATGP
jgi:hypothetical protein